MSNITGEEGSFSSGNTGEEVQQLHHGKQQQQQQFHGSLPSDSAPSLPAAKKKRNLPGTPGTCIILEFNYTVQSLVRDQTPTLYILYA